MDLEKYKNGDSIKVTGICGNNIFFIEDTSFGIYNFETNDDVKVTIKGTFNKKLVEGQTYELKGTIVLYKREKQIKVNEFRVCKPNTKKGIIAYLKTLYGLKSRAENIYNIFGDESIQVLLNNPLEVVNKVRGIGKRSVLKWQKELKEIEDNQYIFIELLNYGINYKNARKLHEKYKDEILKLIEDNPYMLIKEIRGYGFLKCDKIALDLGVELDNINRLKAGVKFLLQEALLSGHCYLPLELIIEDAINLLNLSLSYKEMCSCSKSSSDEIVKFDKTYKLDKDLLTEKICLYEKNKKTKNNYILFSIKEKLILEAIEELINENEIINEDDCIYLKYLYLSEKLLAERLKLFTNYNQVYKKIEVEKVLDEVCSEKGYILETKQREACIEFNLYDNGLFVLNGPAGTGKTFTLNLILEVAKRLSKRKLKIEAVAPTGKASKVVRNATYMDCSTIHRSLGYVPYTGFTMNEFNQFNKDIIVCDEGTMIDIELGWNFIKAIKTTSKLIIMGDVHQLPSVGPGTVLKDIIESQIVKVITLDVLKRQDLLSGIAKNANGVVESKMVCPNEEDKDFYVLERDSVRKVRLAVISSIRRLIDKYGLEEIQVLLPQRTGSLGTNVFNYIIQKEFNPYANSEKKILKTKFEAQIAEVGASEEISLFIAKNDKVIHVKNNYNMALYELKDGSFKKINNTDVTNGECGVVYDIVPLEKGGLRVIVKYDEFFAFYDDGVDELELSYAITIHKSQGSAWRAILLPIVPQHIYMLYNNLIYTGMTRARDFLAMIGSIKTIQQGIKRDIAIKRNTKLKERMLVA
ncbi:SF1B family DNA helicase RecD2 [Clostridioides difficile]